jgi:phosphoglycolate phosphatase
MDLPRDLIFDLDGTLWDTTALCASAWNAAAAELGLEKTDYATGDVADIMGLTADEVRCKLFASLDEATGRRAQALFFRTEVEFLRKSGQDRLYPGVREGIRELARRHRLFLVSNCDVPYMQAFFDLSGLRDAFRDSECFGHTQLPKAANIRLVVVRNAIQSAMYVGDTVGDQKAAALCRLPFAWAAYGFGQCAGADLTLQNFDALSTQLASLR